VPAPSPSVFSRKEAAWADEVALPICGVKGDRSLTIDHVMPRSKGTVGLKHDRTPEQARMPLLRRPREPRGIPWIPIIMHA